ncbi:MAG: hypothetical protein IMY76_07610 [Chloroflexi bacterium]|nr:hypothetical protein [Chloroflexota bacterium]
MPAPRQGHINHFYALLEKLANLVGPSRQLSTTHGRMEWPERGVYFFFENTEHRASAPYGPRVVRVGTHALKSGANTTIWNRLSQHRGNAKDKGGNHRGSIFRDIVGTALMERNNLSYSTWGRRSPASSDIRVAEKPMEQRVSDHIGQMSIICLDIPDEAGPDSLRGYIEQNAIALLSNFEKTAIDPPSKAWLGSYCDREKVRQSGLWNSNHVTESYDPDFLQVFEKLIDQMGGQKSEVTMQKDMKIVIQCAGSKNKGGFLKTGDGRPVVFVANPSLAPENADCIYAHPDGMRSDGKSWRQYLVEYNALKPHNPDGLYAAIDLYRSSAYADLKDTFGAEKVFILSAGWGLVRGDFLLPSYDITFSQSGKSTPYISRAINQDFMDFNMLDLTSRYALVYLGGKDYIPLFCDLTQSYAGERTVIFNAATPPKAPGCLHVKFDTTIRTNWHYECAHRLSKETSWLFNAPMKQGDNLLQQRQKLKSKPEQRAASKSDAYLDIGNVRGSKYKAIYDYLINLPASQDQATLSYSFVGELIGTKLPQSSYTHHQMFWANGGHYYAKFWMEAGFHVEGSHAGKAPEESWVRFQRK